MLRPGPGQGPASRAPAGVRCPAAMPRRAGVQRRRPGPSALARSGGPVGPWGGPVGPWDPIRRPVAPRRADAARRDAAGRGDVDSSVGGAGTDIPAGGLGDGRSPRWGGHRYSVGSVLADGQASMIPQGVARPVNAPTTASQGSGHSAIDDQQVAGTSLSTIGPSGPHTTMSSIREPWTPVVVDTRLDAEGDPRAQRFGVPLTRYGSSCVEADPVPDAMDEARPFAAGRDDLASDSVDPLTGHARGARLPWPRPVPRGRRTGPGRPSPGLPPGHRRSPTGSASYRRRIRRGDHRCRGRSAPRRG